LHLSNKPMESETVQNEDFYGFFDRDDIEYDINEALAIHNQNQNVMTSDNDIFLNAVPESKDIDDLYCFKPQGEGVQSMENVYELGVLERDCDQFILISDEDDLSDPFPSLSEIEFNSIPLLESESSDLH
jgi:hypothetical protein